MTCIVVFAVASRNNDRTVAGKSFAWRLLGMMPSLSKAATVLQTDEWRTDRRTHLYHSCIDILAAQINAAAGYGIATFLPPGVPPGNPELFEVL